MPCILFALLCPVESFFSRLKPLAWLAAVQLIVAYGLPMVVDPYFWGFGGGYMFYGAIFILNICLMIYFQISLLRRIIRSQTSRTNKFIGAFVTGGFVYTFLNLIAYQFFLDAFIVSGPLEKLNAVFYPMVMLSKLFQPLQPLFHSAFNYQTALALWFIVNPLLLLLTYALIGLLVSLIFKRRNQVDGIVSSKPM